jgi:hypothetical protein
MPKDFTHIPTKARLPGKNYSSNSATTFGSWLKNTLSILENKGMTTIASIKATEVIVPAKPGSLNSETVLDKDTAFAKKFITGESWTEFANQPKWIIEITLSKRAHGCRRDLPQRSPAI